MDGAGLGELRYGYHPKVDCYTEPLKALALLEANEVDLMYVKWYYPDPGLTLPVDLILSLLSCGFHYPVDTYAGLIDRSLRKGGRVILDVRKGENRNLPGFCEVGEIGSYEKHHRIVYARAGEA